VREAETAADSLEHAATLLGRMRRARRESAAPAPDALSARELTVLRLLAAGHTNQQIADTLFLAVGSIKKHTHNIYGKLGVTSRVRPCRRRAHEACSTSPTARRATNKPSR
jgi:DNA-binding NarL/FixJ family response regulator